jgi:serine/threonine protein kinase
MAEEHDTQAGQGLDDFVEAFEARRAEAADTDLADFLPAPEDPLHLDVLRELVRVDLEYGWSCGRPLPLADYRERFPELFADARAAAEVAFEEYRLRCQAGEDPTPEEYQREGFDTGLWPATLVVPPDPLPDAESWGSHSRGAAEAAGLGESTALAPAPGSLRAQPPAGLPDIGERFLGFRLAVELGRGAFGRVYLAEQGDLANRLVVLKVGADLVGESRTLAQLQHTYIVPIFSAHQVGKWQALCMPYFGACTLADVLAHLRALPAWPHDGRALAEAVRARGQHFPVPAGVDPEALHHLESADYVTAVLGLVNRLSEGLAHAHDHGVVHQDLKPANVLLTAEGRPMLLDFNLSSHPGGPAGAARVGGTLAYMAPEQLEAFAGRTRPVDGRCDLYALGVILYELLTGRPPFPLSQAIAAGDLPRLAAQRLGAPPRLRPHNRAVSPATESIVRRLLEPDAGRRYQRVEQLREDVGRQLAHRPLRHAADRSPRERLRKWLRRHPRLRSPLSAAVLVLAGVAGVLGWSWWQESGARQADREEAARTLQAERQLAAEALAQFRAAFAAAREQADRAQVVLGAFDQGLFEPEGEEVLARCRSALDGYHVLEDPRWQEAAAVRLLPPEERRVLLDDMGELLYLLARSSLFAAVPHGVTALREPARYALPGVPVSWAPLDAARAAADIRIDLARRAHDLARGCYVPAGRPLALGVQSAVLAELAGDGAAAQRLFAEAAAGKPRSPHDAYLAATEYAALGDYARALPLAEAARREYPERAGAWLLAGLCQARVGAAAQAERAFDVCLALLPGWPAALYHRGMTRLQRRDWAGAAEDLDALLGARPGLREAYPERARARQELHQYAAAEEDLARALERLPAAHCQLYYQRALLREAAGDRRGAADDRAAAARSDATDAAGYACRGLARSSQDSEGALDDFDRALSLDSRCLAALRGKAAVLAGRPGALLAAEEVLDAALTYYPDVSAVRLERADVRARRGRAAEARSDVEAVLARDGGLRTRYEAACVLAQLAGAEVQDRRRAVRLLAEAVRGGYGADLLSRDRRLIPLHGERGFEDLLRAARVLGDSEP